jgi:hypothetical protein
MILCLENFKSFTGKAKIFCFRKIGSNKKARQWQLELTIKYAPKIANKGNIIIKNLWYFSLSYERKC